jgi:ABC-type glycerol-3-phosphate transport system substrate-binding protein
MRDAIRTQAVPESVSRLGDAGSFYVFSSGRARFLRSWPYVQPRFLREAKLAAARGNETAPARLKTARNLGVAPLPPWRAGGPSVGVLGGHNLVIPRSSKNPEAALRLVDFLTSSDQALRDARTASLAPVLSDAWRDPDVQADPQSKAEAGAEPPPGSRGGAAIQPGVVWSRHSN